MQRRLLVKANRQVAIAAHLTGVHQIVAGAVHRLEAHLLAFGLDEEHVLAIVLPVPGRDPEVLVEDDRRLHLGVAGWNQDAPHVVAEGVVEHRPLRQPERRTRRPLVEHEQALIAADLAVVALLGLFDAAQILLQLLVGEEGRAVDALHRLVARVALPVGVRRGQQLEGLQLARGWDVRSDAEIDEGLLVLDRVAGDVRLSFGLLLDQLHLQRLASGAEELLRLVPRPHLSLEGQILIRELPHPLLDGVEILRHERLRDDEVVEEAFVGRRTDAALHAGEHVGDRGGEQMRRAVAVERQRVGRVLRGDDLHRRISRQRVRQIDQPIADLSRQGRLRETGRDRRGQIGDRGAGRHTSARSIG